MNAAAPAPSNLFYQTRQRRPLISEARGVYIWDVDGKRYLDGSSGAMVANIGHGNERVLEAMRQQMAKATFGYRLHFENEPAERLARLTAERMPKGLNKVFFVSGGSEAVESAIKLARQWAVATDQATRWKVISRTPSYHGGTLGALALTGMHTMTDPFAPMMREMPKVPAPRAYLDRDNLDDEARGLKYADMLRERIIEEGPESVLAFIMEPIGGASTGALVAPDSYHARIREICDEFGILLILDEVMTGAGRTGRFMAAEHWNLKADIVTMSKGFASGYVPLGAMVADETIVEPVLEAGGFIHGYTYAGNPLACAAGLAVLQEIEREDLVTRAERMGSELKLQLEGLMDRFPFIGDVRGKGLLLAFELVCDRKTMRPLAKEIDAHVHLVEEAYKRGLIIYSRRTHGTSGDHFMVCPPLIVDESHIVEIIETLEESLTALAHRFDLPLVAG
ncbi:aminotransferase family protein [Pararhizobium haloflavum]|uniref:aminotransferase family protein n=1 Tax=Pararhizobium haloflavum TaxID=2037914 RepID=UPI000C188D8C|nr:aspartate aminotransferase family protein [Pararhizobium haloflavum]